MSLEVNLFGIDFSELLMATPVIRKQVSEGIVLEKETEIKFYNKNNCFMAGNTNSIIHGLTVIGEKITIIKDNETIFEGIITSEKIAGAYYVLMAQSIFANYMQSNVTLFETSNTTPAFAIRDLLESFNLDDYIDYHSIGESNNIYVNNNVLINVYINASDNMTLVQAINNIANMGVGAVYVNDENKICFDVFQEYKNGTLYNITAGDMVNYPKIETSISSEIITNYNVNYLYSGNVPAVYSLGKTEGKTWSFDGGNTGAFQICDYTSAVWLGNRKILQMGTQKRKLSFMLRNDFQPAYMNNTKLVTFSDYGFLSTPMRLKDKQNNSNLISVTYGEI